VTFLTVGPPPPPFAAEICRSAVSLVADVGASLHAARSRQQTAAVNTRMFNSLDTGECTYPVLR